MKDTNILKPYEIKKQFLKDYGTFILFQVWGTRENETKMTPLYKVCEWK